MSEANWVPLVPLADRCTDGSATCVTNCVDENGNPIPIIVDIGGGNIMIEGDVSVEKYSTFGGKVCTADGEASVIFEINEGVVSVVGYILPDGTFSTAQPDLVECVTEIDQRKESVEVVTTCMWDVDTSSNPISVTPFVQATAICATEQADGSITLDSQDLGQFTDSTLATAYTPTGTVQPTDSVGSQPQATQSRNLTIDGESTYSPAGSPYMLSMTVVAVGGTVSVVDSDGTTADLRATQSRSWTSDGSLPLVPPTSIVIPAGASVDVHWTEPQL